MWTSSLLNSPTTQLLMLGKDHILAYLAPSLQTSGKCLVAVSWPWRWLWLRGRALVIGRSLVQFPWSVKLSLGKILNPKPLLMCCSAPRMAATANQCMDVCMKYCKSLWTKVPDKYPKCKLLGTHYVCWAFPAVFASSSHNAGTGVCIRCH